MKSHHTDERPSRIEFTFSARVCGDGRVLPIVESIGRRVVREIDPEGREGRRLLADGKVTLRSADGRLSSRVPVGQFLTRMKEEISGRASEHPRDRQWKRHCLEIARSVSRSRARLSH
jgi:hypothetical protein